MESNPAQPEACLCPQTKNSSSPTFCRKLPSRSGFRRPGSTRSKIRQSPSFGGSIQLLLVLGHSFSLAPILSKPYPREHTRAFPTITLHSAWSCPAQSACCAAKYAGLSFSERGAGVDFGDSIPFHPSIGRTPAKMCCQAFSVGHPALVPGCRIRASPKILDDCRRICRFENPLGQDDRNQSSLRVIPPRRAQPAVPSVPSWLARQRVGLQQNGHSKSPAGFVSQY